MGRSASFYFKKNEAGGRTARTRRMAFLSLCSREAGGTVLLKSSVRRGRRKAPRFSVGCLMGTYDVSASFHPLSSRLKASAAECGRVVGCCCGCCWGCRRQRGEEEEDGAGPAGGLKETKAWAVCCGVDWQEEAQGQNSAAQRRVTWVRPQRTSACLFMPLYMVVSRGVGGCSATWKIYLHQGKTKRTRAQHQQQRRQEQRRVSPCHDPHRACFGLVRGLWVRY